MQVTRAQALLRGFFCRCPNCGEGKLFGRYLKVVDHCAVCGEAFHHHRADDFPPYIVILITGHIIVPLACGVAISYALSVWMNIALWLPLTLIMTLGLLQPVKGAVVAFQWHMGMHGFGEARNKPQ